MRRNHTVEPDVREGLEEILAEQKYSTTYEITELSGGTNNRLYKIEFTTGPTVVLKHYYRGPNDNRDRLVREYSFLQYASNRGLQCTPEPIAKNESRGLGLYSWISGVRPEASSIDSNMVRQSADFIFELNSNRPAYADSKFRDASESCFSIQDHFQCVENRLRQWQRQSFSESLHREVKRFVDTVFSPAWEELKSGCLDELQHTEFGPEEKVPGCDRILSPSDFGFHNTLVDENGDVCFLDFEYAGWDDPAKLTGDYFGQPEIPLPPELHTPFLDGVEGLVQNKEFFEVRRKIAAPVQRFKWCLILLNDFLPDERDRRKFSNDDADEPERLRKQFRQAKEYFDAHVIPGSTSPTLP